MNTWQILALCILMITPPGRDDAPSAHILTIDGSEQQGMLRSWRAETVLVFAANNGHEVRVDSQNVDHVTFAEANKIPAHGTWMIQARGEARLVGDITDGNEHDITMIHSHLGKIRIPLDHLIALSRHGERIEVGRSDASDAIRLMNGDITLGLITEINRDGVRLFADNIEQTRPWSVIKAIRFAHRQQTRPLKPQIQLRWTDGSVWPVSSLTRDDRQMRAVLAEGQSIVFNETFLASAEMIGGRRIWLCEQPTERYQSLPFFDHPWPKVADRNVFSGPLRMADRNYHHGLGLHAACHLSWRLDNQYERLTGWVGIDDSAGRWADADLTLLVDDRVMASFLGLHHGESPRPINIDLRGGNELTIKIGFGRNGGVQDRVDLVRPALIRRSANPDTSKLNKPHR